LVEDEEMTDLTKLRAALRQQLGDGDEQPWSDFLVLSRDEGTAILDALDAAERERDEALKLAHQATRRALLPRVVSDAEVVLTIKDRAP
jgi:hypothetical protein